MKISKTKKGNVSIIIETDQELYYLYSISNTSPFDIRNNAKQLAVDVDEGEQTLVGVSVDLFHGLRKLVEEKE